MLSWPLMTSALHKRTRTVKSGASGGSGVKQLLPGFGLLWRLPAQSSPAGRCCAGGADGERKHLRDAGTARLAALASSNAAVSGCLRVIILMIS